MYNNDWTIDVPAATTNGVERAGKLKANETTWGLEECKPTHNEIWLLQNEPPVVLATGSWRHRSGVS